MPRIPVYKQQVGYHVPTVQAAQVARPIAKIPSNTAMNLRKWGEGLTFIQDAPELVETVSSGVSPLFRQLKNLIPKKKQTTPADGIPSDSEEFEQAEDSGPIYSAGGEEEADETNWTSARREMMSSVKKSAEKSPLENLDAYAAQAWTQNQGSGAAGAESFAQDYGILRREVASCEERSKNDTLKTQWAQDADYSIKMASFIKTPKALETYLHDNEPQIRERADKLGLDGKSAVKTLRENAVVRNVETSLAAQDPVSAAVVYRAFEKQMSPSAKKSLEPKLQSARAEQLGRGVWVQAQKEGENVSPDAVVQFASEQLGDQPENVRKEAVQYAQMFSRQAQREGFLRQSENCRALRSAPDFQSARRTLLAGYAPQEADFKSNESALRNKFERPEQKSDAASFNGLYQRVGKETFDSRSLEGAFESGKINGSDYLFLKQTHLERLCGPDEGDIIRCAAERFCRKKELSGAEAEMVKYRVFSAPGTAEDKMSALRRMKEILAD